MSSPTTTDMRASSGNSLLLTGPRREKPRHYRSGSMLLVRGATASNQTSGTPGTAARNRTPRESGLCCSRPNRTGPPALMGENGKAPLGDGARCDEASGPAPRPELGREIAFRRSYRRPSAAVLCATGAISLFCATLDIDFKAVLPKAGARHWQDV